ncbi:MAG TPA: NAD(P)/FAD-dependent oxidoreductase [Gemmatimonadaceae bacterium]|nr:NAD(P)/FAD-dependent oxidoreductase [Gemmatimonadaceae bacterium]
MTGSGAPAAGGARKVAVIAGAGPAGLTAAWELLARTDVMPVVIEPTPATGGIAQTHVFKGNRIDLGGHRFFSKSKRVMDWWFAILPRQGAPASDDAANTHDVEMAGDVAVRQLVRGEDGRARVVERTRRAPDPAREDAVMLQRPRLSRIYWRRNFFPYPLGITLSVAWRLGVFTTAAIGLSYLRARLFPRRDETYLDAFFTNRFGRRLYETFFRGYTEKVWGVPCAEIRADWGAQRIKGLSLVRALTHAVRDLLSSDFAKQQRTRETSLITRFFYPKLGPGQIWEEVERQVTDAGGSVRHGAKVVGVTLADGRVSHVTVEDVHTGKREAMPCDWLLSTMPVRELVATTTPAPPPAVREVADGLRYRDFMTVGLLLRRLHVQERGRAPQSMVRDNWIYVQDESVQVGRIQVFNNWSPYLVADPANTVWIGLEYFLNETDALWRMRDADLVALATRELEQIGFARAADVIDGCVLRMPKAYPAYFGTYDRLDEVRRWVNGIPNLFCVGRNGMHRYNNQDHSMLTAMLAVDNLVAGRDDDSNLWDVNLEMVYQEE